MLSRIDRDFVFPPLKDLDIARVAALEIERMITSYGLGVEDGGIDTQILIDLTERQRRARRIGLRPRPRPGPEGTIADTLIEARHRGAARIGLVDIDGTVRTVADA